jgi:hypothetical protein
MYRPNFYESTCFRCKEIVYQVDRIGPLKDFTFFHTGCFRCKVCESKLTLKTYFNNQHNQDDKEVSSALIKFMSTNDPIKRPISRYTLAIFILIKSTLIFSFCSLRHSSWLSYIFAVLFLWMKNIWRLVNSRNHSKRSIAQTLIASKHFSRRNARSFDSKISISWVA